MEEKINFEENRNDEENSNEVTPESFQNNVNWIRIPEVGQEISLSVKKVVNNKVTKMITGDGDKFNVGVTDKNGKTTRYDIVCEEGTFTIKNWEIYFKLFGKEGVLLNYSKTHNNLFSGAKLKIKRLIDGQHKSTKLADLMKILGVSEEDAKKYQESVKLAITEKRLYEVTLVE